MILIDLERADFPLADFVTQARGLDPELPILILTSDISKLHDEKLWLCEVDDVIPYPSTDTAIKHRIDRAFKMHMLEQRFSELSREKEQLTELAATDGLTKLFNRRYFNDRIGKEFARIKRHGGQLGCVMIDIDHFKNVNDTYGHLTGDRILRELAQIITMAIRESDTAARYGGEEFVLLLPETSLEATGKVAEKIRKRVADYNFNDPSDLETPGPEHLTISLGAAGYPHPKVSTPQEMVSLADHSLYHAKENGRNRVEIAKSEG
jgi:two-component system cell cycle response regulator